MLWTMKSMISFIFVVVGLMLMMPAAVEARALYCDGRLVQVGDPIWQVGRACPEPFWREDFDEPISRDRRGHTVGWQRVESWTLNFGPNRFMRRLIFLNGTLHRIESLGYGVRWEPGTNRCNWRDLEQAGNTAAEIFARCGEPDYRYQLPASPQFGGRAGPAPVYGQRERWIYDYNQGRNARELLFHNGRLQQLQRHR